VLFDYLANGKFTSKSANPLRGSNNLNERLQQQEQEQEREPGQEREQEKKQEQEL
jgi:hypothetical protein